MGAYRTAKSSSVFKSDDGEKLILEACDGILASWPVPYSLDRVDTCLGSTCAIVCGARESPPLVLIHGSGTNSLFWKGEIASYAVKYRVYAIDLPGEPGFSSRTRGSWEGSDYVRWLGDAMEGFGLGQARFIGVSIGGFHALRFACAFPGMATKLVLLGSSGLAPQRLSFIPKAIFAMAFGSGGVDRIMKIVNGSARIPAEALEFARLLALQTNSRMERVPLICDADLLRLSMPILAIGGTDDALLDTRSGLTRLASLVPGSRTMELPGTGHVVTGMVDTILEFLEET